VSDELVLRVSGSRGLGLTGASETFGEAGDSAFLGRWDFAVWTTWKGNWPRLWVSPDELRIGVVLLRDVVVRRSSGDAVRFSRRPLGPCLERLGATGGRWHHLCSFHPNVQPRLLAALVRSGWMGPPVPGPAGEVVVAAPPVQFFQPCMVSRMRRGWCVVDRATMTIEGPRQARVVSRDEVDEVRVAPGRGPRDVNVVLTNSECIALCRTFDPDALVDGMTARGWPVMAPSARQ